MTQHEIDCAVALATGETVTEIQHLGFGLADPQDVDHDPEPHSPLVLDWDTGYPSTCLLFDFLTERVQAGYGP